MNIVLLSHGPLASAMKETVEIITGEQPNLYSVSLLENDTPQTFQEKLLGIVEKFPNECVLICDLFGGTPCNIATLIKMKFPQIPVIAGMNMSLVVELCLDDNALANSSLLDEIKENIKFIELS